MKFIAWNQRQKQYYFIEDKSSSLLTSTTNQFSGIQAIRIESRFSFVSIAL